MALSNDIQSWEKRLKRKRTLLDKLERRPDPEKRYPLYCMRMGGCPANMDDLIWQATEDYMNELMAEPRKQ